VLVKREVGMFELTSKSRQGIRAASNSVYCTLQYTASRCGR